MLLGEYEIDTSSRYINISIQALTEAFEPSNGILFIESLNEADLFSLQEHELRLYYNDNQNYLLFKPRKS
jgi:hypothetical protein